MSVEAYTAYRRASRRRSSRTPFNPLKSIENEVQLENPIENTDLDDIGIRIKTEAFEDSYTIIEELGRGKFATVKKCSCNITKEHYAAKVQRKTRKAKDARREIFNEIRMLAICKIHPHIIRLCDVFETRHEIIIVTNYASGGELYKHIEDGGGFPETTVKTILQQTLEALTFLHARNIVHMDIKPQNLLLLDSDISSHLQLCDLGFSRIVNSGQDVRDIVGTPDFVAPEILNYEPIDTSVDMWSTGVLTYMMLSGCSPFAGKDKMETFSNITQAQLDFPNELFKHITNWAKDFIQKLLLRDPRRRLSAPECLEHPWLKYTENKKEKKLVSADVEIFSREKTQSVELDEKSLAVMKGVTSAQEQERVIESSSVECCTNSLETNEKEVESLSVVLEVSENIDTVGKSKSQYEHDNCNNVLKSALASPVGCRRSLKTSPDTLLEPFVKYPCRRCNLEMKQVAHSFSSEHKSCISGLDSDEHIDRSAIVTRCGDIKRTRITSVPHTKSLVTFYENLQNS